MLNVLHVALTHAWTSKLRSAKRPNDQVTVFAKYWVLTMFVLLLYTVSVCEYWFWFFLWIIILLRLVVTLSVVNYCRTNFVILNGNCYIWQYYQGSVLQTKRFRFKSFPVSWSIGSDQEKRKEKKKEPIKKIVILHSVDYHWKFYESILSHIRKYLQKCWYYGRVASSAGMGKGNIRCWRSVIRELALLRPAQVLWGWCWRDVGVLRWRCLRCRVFQRTVGVPVGTGCASLLADLFLCSCGAEFIRGLLHGRGILLLWLRLGVWICQRRFVCWQYWFSFMCQFDMSQSIRFGVSILRVPMSPWRSGLLTQPVIWVGC